MSHPKTSIMNQLSIRHVQWDYGILYQYYFQKADSVFMQAFTVMSREFFARSKLKVNINSWEFLSLLLCGTPRLVTHEHSSRHMKEDAAILPP